jgi:hypothetical protein
MRSWFEQFAKSKDDKKCHQGAWYTETMSLLQDEDKCAFEVVKWMNKCVNLVYITKV